MPKFVADVDKTVYVPGTCFNVALRAGVEYTTDDEREVVVLRNAMGVKELDAATARKPKPEPEEPEGAAEVEDASEDTAVRVIRRKK